MSVVDPVLRSSPSCPQCGFDGARSQFEDVDARLAQQKISELETQIKFLNRRAAATGILWSFLRALSQPGLPGLYIPANIYNPFCHLVAEKLADYEDEIRLLRSKSQPAYSSTTALPQTPTLGPQAQGASPSPPQPKQPQHNRLATLTSFLPYGKRLSSSANGAPLTHTVSSPESSIASPPRTADSTLTASLQGALQREQELRKAAESRLTQANSELEELTTQLFSQANEMVAQERKARAKLEERVELLEKRDSEKRRRLDRLEKAIQRVERVRGMVG
ncbi:hypothetical protein LOZ53_001778 [Ophidiomyces ophidiicola]|nr:hypothetical protein LOZ51_005663 [Ophidiomyces ophidiicola]KAI1994651.1 hypothetical protein LOZ53_001778 [Ophidiomyces ophidiicola]